MVTTPATGMLTWDCPTSCANAGTAIARPASLTWSTAVLTVPLSSPDGSVYRVSAMPSFAAAAFIRATNAAGVPASHRARICAMLSAEGSSRAVSACRSVSTSPAATRTRDWLAAAWAG